MSSYARTKRVRLEVNALGASQAIDMALEAATDIAFDEPCPEWDEEEELPAPSQMTNFECCDLGGYSVVVIRRGYSSSPGGGEYSADYAVETCDGPFELYLSPALQDDSSAYKAELERVHLQKTTADISLRKASSRF